jgi:hypothetical protein
LRSGESPRVLAVAAIDRAVLADWLSDETAIDSLLEKFRDTALDTEREGRKIARARAGFDRSRGSQT